MSAITLLKKSALALAIASVSVSAYSESVNLIDKPIYKSGRDLPTGLTVTGSSTFEATEATGESNEVVVSIEDTKVTGDIILNAKINMTGPDATALEVGAETSDSGEPKQTVINGNIINKGEINFTGDVGWGIAVYAGEDDMNLGENTKINGSIVNDGTINITQAGNLKDTYLNDPATAIEVSFTDFNKQGERDGYDHNDKPIKYTTNVGGIYNNKDIILSGDNVTGIYSTNKSTIGVIENTGTITATGKNVRGIHVDGGSKVNEIENYGTISVTSTGKTQQVGDYVMDPSGAIVVEDSTVYRIDNEEDGVINASGADVSAIYVDESIVYGIENEGRITATNGASAIKVKNTSINEINNDGTIEVSGQGAAGIYLEGTDRTQDNPYSTQIQNGGTIRATNGALAIKVVGASVILDWDAGLIDGNVEGLAISVIDEEVTFAGTSFESGLIRVGDFGDDNYYYDDDEGLPTVVKFTQTHTTLKTNNKLVDFNDKQIAGGLRVADDARLAVQISNKTDASKAIIAVEGLAEFGKGSGINVSSAQGLTLDGKDYILLSTTQGLMGAGLDGERLVTGTQLLKVNSYEVKGKQIIANVSVESSQAIVDAVTGAGGNKNSQAVAQELNTLIEAIPDSAFKDALMAAGTSPAALAAAMEQLSPEVNGAGVQAAATGQNIITGATSSRTGSLRGKSSGEALKETGVWVQTLYSDASQGTRDGIKGYNAYSSGLAIGADGKPSDDVTVGVAYSYLNTTVNGKSNSNTDVKGHAFTLYGGYELGNYFVDGNLTYSANSNDATRNVLGTKAKGSYDSDMLGASVTAGYTFNLDGNIVLEPLLAARYANIKIDGFSEKGSPAALTTGSQRYEIAELGVGARVATNYALGQGTLEPQVQVMALHDLAADQTKSTSAFIAGGNPFVASGAKPVRNSYEASVGADYRLGALTFGANYGYTGKSGFNSDTFSAKVRYDF